MKTVNIRKYLVASALLLCLMSCSRKRDFVPLKLVEGRENKLVAAPERLTPKFVEQMKVILNYYGEEFEVTTGGALRVSKKLAENKELLWNYCTKADDDAFVSSIVSSKKTGESATSQRSTK